MTGKLNKLLLNPRKILNILGFCLIKTLSITWKHHIDNQQNGWLTCEIASFCTPANSS